MNAFWIWLSSTEGTATIVGSALTFVFGLIALVTGALFNSHLNRRRDDRRRAEEMKSVAAALYGEILPLREQVAYVGRVTAATYIAEGDRNSMSRFDERFLEQNTLRDPVLFPALAARLGLLPPDLVLAITRFHDNYQSARFWLPKLVRDDKRPFDYSTLHVLMPVQSAILDIDPALRRIEALLGIPEPAPTPSLGDMPLVIDLEEDLFSQAPPPES